MEVRERETLRWPPSRGRARRPRPTAARATPREARQRSRPPSIVSATPRNHGLSRPLLTSSTHVPSHGHEGHGAHARRAVPEVPGGYG